MPKTPISELPPEEAEKVRAANRERANKHNKKKRNKKNRQDAVESGEVDAKSAVAQETNGEKLAAGIWNTLERIAVAIGGDEMKTEKIEHEEIVRAGGALIDSWKPETADSPGLMLAIAVGGYGLSRAPVLYKKFKGEDLVYPIDMPAVNETSPPQPPEAA